MAKYKVLSTKKLEPSLIQIAKQNGIEIIEQEAIRVNPILSKEKWEEIFQLLQSKKQFAAFTSSNAVLALKTYFDDYKNPFEVRWNVFSLSGKTKNALEESLGNFGVIVGTADDSRALAGKIIQRQVDEIIFFCGNKRRDDLPQILKAAGINVHEVVVYETEEIPTRSNQHFDAVLFFSPSAVQSFFSVNQLNSHTVCFAIGQTTADSIATGSGNKVILSKTPGQDALLEEVINYFKTMVSQS